MYVHTRIQIVPHLYTGSRKCPNKSAKQTPALFLFVCYKLAFGLNGARDALKARREDYLSPGPDLLPEQTFKMRINFVGVGAGRGWGA